MKVFGACWVTFLYENLKHRHLLTHGNTNSDRIFFDFCMIPKPTIKQDSPDPEWHSYINHVVETFPDGKIHWDKGNGAWIYGSQGLKGLLYGMKALGRIPMVCFGHCEEKPNSWVTRSPTGESKLLWIRRFIKEFAKYMINTIGIPEAIFEVWNEPIECMTPPIYGTLSEQFGIALKNTNYKLAIGSNDFRHLDWLGQVCSNSNLMKDVDYITTHYIWDEDWNLGVPEMIHGKLHIVSECNFLKKLDRVDEVKKLEGLYYLYLGKTEKLTWNVCDYPWTWNTANPNEVPVLGSSYDILRNLLEGELMPEERDLKIIPGYMHGDDVKKVQTKLREIGFDLKIDSWYGRITEAAIKKFQELMNLSQNGVVDKNVKEMLEAITVETFYPEVFKNIYESKNYSIEATDYYLNEFAHPDLKGHGKYFVQAEQESGVPVEWQLANGAAESSYKGGGIGSSPIAQKYFNLYGWGVPDSGITAEGRFGSFAECILYVPKKIKSLFLDPNNWRYHGDHIFGIEVYYSTAVYNAINKAKYYRKICGFMDQDIKHRIPEYVEDLIPLLSEYFIKK